MDTDLRMDTFAREFLKFFLACERILVRDLNKPYLSYGSMLFLLEILGVTYGKNWTNFGEKNDKK